MATGGLPPSILGWLVGVFTAGAGSTSTGPRRAAGASTGASMTKAEASLISGDVGADVSADAKTGWAVISGVVWAKADEGA